jgi:hypothetical protein
MMIRKVLAAAATTGIALTVGLTAVPSAFAAEGDGNCVTNDAGAGGDLCLYYNSNLAGARFNDPYTDNYAGWVFKAWSGGDAGAGQAVKNNAASVRNYDPYVTGVVYYNSNQAGPSESISPSSWVNLNSTLKNENASQGWD